MPLANWLARLQHQPPGLPRGVTPEAWALAGNPIQGTCPVCGTRRVQFCGFTENLRESGACSQCGAANRQRQMALVLRKKLRLATRGPCALPAGCRLYNAEITGALHATLASSPGYVCSGYWGDEYASGSIVNGVRHEDLERLSFADDTLDLILTSDVLEHVSDAYRAHGEIFRTLRPGGWHIFTVPFDPSLADDDVRARRHDGGIEYLAEPLYHGDPLRPDQGVLVWRIFGREMLTRLAQIGFRTATMQVRSPDHGILGDNALVFAARKPRRWRLGLRRT
jgi:SAM-dependent methyltransferase